MVDTDDTRRTMDDGRQTMPWVWHKLPTGELKQNKKIAQLFNRKYKKKCKNNVITMLYHYSTYIKTCENSEKKEYHSIKSVKIYVES